jgi:sec-independent protein translocase protein TatA
MRLGSLGPVELILIVLAIVLIFGASKLGDLGGALGKSVKEFKKATKDEEAEAAERQQATTAPPPANSAEPPSPTVTTQAPQPAAAVGVGDYRPPDAAPPKTT